MVVVSLFVCLSSYFPSICPDSSLLLFVLLITRLPMNHRPLLAHLCSFSFVSLLIASSFWTTGTMKQTLALSIRFLSTLLPSVHPYGRQLILVLRYVCSVISCYLHLHHLCNPSVSSTGFMTTIAVRLVFRIVLVFIPLLWLGLHKCGYSGEAGLPPVELMTKGIAGLLVISVENLLSRRFRFCCLVFFFSFFVLPCFSSILNYLPHHHTLLSNS